MKKKLQKYLESLGLAAGTSEAKAIIFWQKLTGDERAAADALSEGSEDAGESADKDAGGEGVGSGDEPADKDAGGEGAGSGEESANEDASGDDTLSAANAAKATALAADRKRRDGIMALAKKHDFDAVAAQDICDRMVPLSQAQELIILASNHKLVPMANGAGGQIRVSEDRDRSTLAGAIEDAIALRSGSRMIQLDEVTGVALRDSDGKALPRKPHDRAVKFQRLSILGMGRQFLASLGVADVGLMGNVQLAKLLLNPRALQDQCGVVALAQGISDFPYILANVLRKTLRAEYAETKLQWPLFCSRNTVPDYKQFSMVSLSEAPDLVEATEELGVQYGTLSENREQATLAIFTKGIRFTHKAMVNDDLNAFSRVPRIFGPAAARKEDDLAYAILTANAALGQDSIALFDAATHDNYITAGAAPSVATLNVGAAKMGTQRGIGGASYLDIEPKSILVPMALAGTAKQLIASVVDPAKSNATTNIWHDRLQVIANARLDASSATGWYLAADPSRVDTIAITFLDEEQTPVIESETDFDTGDLKIKVRHSAVAKAIDYRGVFWNDGVT